MSGTSSTGVHRLRKWAIAGFVGVAVMSALPTPAWASPTNAVARAERMLTVGGDALPGAGAALPGAALPGAALPGAGAAVAPAVTATAADGVIGGGGIDGQAAAATDLSLDSVAGPPRAVPWIVAALLALVVAGAVRAYGRSPQRAALRDRRAQP